MIALLSILVIVVLFCLTIFVHELGHFLVARACGLQVDVFSIGMGPAIWQKKVGSTTYKISWLPLGGYVALPQMDPNSFLEGSPEKPADAEGDAPRDLPPIPPWKKIIVSFAGATGNVVFAFLLCCIIWFIGKPMALSEKDATVGYIATNSPALTAGLLPGGMILALDETPVANWEAIAMYAAFAPDAAIQVHAQNPDGSPVSFAVETKQNAMGVTYLPGLDCVDYCLVAETYPNSPAAAAGLLPGDELLSLNGQKAYSRGHFAQMINASVDEPNELEIRRNSEILTLTLTPRYDPVLQRGLIGILFNVYADYDTGLRSHPTPWSQFREQAASIFIFLKRLVTPKTATQAASGLGGPVLIFLMFWTTIQLGAGMVLWFTAFLNINLAIINLLPLPVLDGGHIVMNLWHILRGRPIPAKIINALAQFFAILLILAFLLITYRDIQRTIVPWAKNKLGITHAEDKPVIFDSPSTNTPVAEPAPPAAP